MTPIRSLFLISVSSLLALACGGTVTGGASPDQDGGPGGSGVGGGGPGFGGGRATGGAQQGVGGGVCCFAAAICKDGETEIAGPNACPPGASCYSNSICCSTVWCARATAQCEAYPACAAGDREIQGACPPSYACYGRTLCGTTITCLHLSPPPGDAGSGVDSGPACPGDHNQHYLSTSSKECTLIDYACPSGTKPFSNACGCGCVQPATCPETVGCMPTLPQGPMDPLCADTSKCPYSLRAL